MNKVSLAHLYVIAGGMLQKHIFIWFVACLYLMWQPFQHKHMPFLLPFLLAELLKCVHLRRPTYCQRHKNCCLFTTSLRQSDCSSCQTLNLRVCRAACFGTNQLWTFEVDLMNLLADRYYRYRYYQWFDRTVTWRKSRQNVNKLRNNSRKFSSTFEYKYRKDN